jgi:hypothetical protein
MHVACCGFGPLHERAIARGAPPHWLGQLAVDDLLAMAQRRTSRRSTLPSWSAAEDPQGAAFGLAQAGQV